MIVNNYFVNNIQQNVDMFCFFIIFAQTKTMVNLINNMDRNDCRFVGRIGDRMKEGVTINGDAYMYFDLELEARANATSTDNNYHQNIPIMLFRKPVIDYLKRLKVRRGTLVVVFGFVSTYTDEIRGITLKNNGINAYEVYVVKTKAD